MTMMMRRIVVDDYNFEQSSCFCFASSSTDIILVCWFGLGSQFRENGKIDNSFVTTMMMAIWSWWWDEHAECDVINDPTHLSHLFFLLYGLWLIFVIGGKLVAILHDTHK